MKIGTLYRIKKYYWLLFSSKESASAIDEDRGICISVADAAWEAARYHKRYNENVSYISPDSYLVFLEEDRKVKKVLTSDGTIGWTWFQESWNNNFEEINQQ